LFGGYTLKPINHKEVQEIVNSLRNEELYLHLETTNGAYASHNDDKKMTVGAYIRNTKVVFTQGKLVGTNPYRIGLKTDLGWIYAEGLTDWHFDDKERLLLAGHDQDGKLAVALQLSKSPF
jgi:hypothetical protein